MEDKKESLEEKAKRLLKLQVMKKPREMLITFDFQSFEEDIPALNYLVREGYAVEVGELVKDFHYEATPKGKEWALS